MYRADSMFYMWISLFFGKPFSVDEDNYTTHVKRFGLTAVELNSGWRSHEDDGEEYPTSEPIRK